MYCLFVIYSLQGPALCTCRVYISSSFLAFVYLAITGCRIFLYAWPITKKACRPAPIWCCKALKAPSTRLQRNGVFQLSAWDGYWSLLEQARGHERSVFLLTCRLHQVIVAVVACNQWFLYIFGCILIFYLFFFFFYHQQRGGMRVLSVVLKRSVCVHQHGHHLRSLCWVHRVVKLLLRWIWAAFRAKCSVQCWMRWSRKTTLGPPRKLVEGTLNRKKPQCSWTLPPVSSAETSFSDPLLTSRF